MSNLAYNMSNDWHKQRRTGIGGSDCASVMGVSKWGTPLGVYLAKRGESVPQQDNPAMEAGRRLEPVVRQWYSDETGKVVRIPSQLLRHQKYPWMIANLDGFVDDPRVVEIKTARMGTDWGEPGTDEIPMEYMFQVQHYLIVTGFELADVPVLIGGSDFRIYHVEADRELQEMIIDREAEFWEMVVNGTPPEPVSYSDTFRRYPKSTVGEVVASEQVLSAVERLRSIKEQSKALEAEEECCKADIQKAIGEMDTLIGLDGKPLATWKSQKGRASFDTKALEKEYPEIYAKFSKTGDCFRVLRLKGE